MHNFLDGIFTTLIMPLNGMFKEVPDIFLLVTEESYIQVKRSDSSVRAFRGGNMATEGGNDKPVLPHKGLVRSMPMGFNP